MVLLAGGGETRISNRAHGNGNVHCAVAAVFMIITCIFNVIAAQINENNAISFVNDVFFFPMNILYIRIYGRVKRGKKTVMLVGKCLSLRLLFHYAMKTFSFTI